MVVTCSVAPQGIILVLSHFKVNVPYLRDSWSVLLPMCVRCHSYVGCQNRGLGGSLASLLKLFQLKSIKKIHGVTNSCSQ